MNEDILKRAKKALIDDDMTYEDYDECISLLIAEVEAKDKQIKELQNIINKPPEEAQWMTDYHLLQSALDGPIIESARRWHGAFRKAQNSNLIRLQQNERLEAEVERLRSQLEESQIKYGVDIASTDLHWQDEIAAKDARIAELEADRIAYRNLGSRMEDLETYIERLEAAFLKSETERKFYTTINGMNSEFDWNGYPEHPQYGIHKEWFRQQAREALERIKEAKE